MVNMILLHPEGIFPAVIKEELAKAPDADLVLFQMDDRHPLKELHGEAFREELTRRGLIDADGEFTGAAASAVGRSLNLFRR